MTTQTHNCVHEDKWGHTEAQLEKLETKHNYNQDLIRQMMEDSRRFEEKLDKKLDTTDKKLDNISQELHDFKLESTKDDSSIDNRVTSLEQTVKVLKYLITLLFGSGIVWALITIH